MAILVVGSVAFDSIETPHGKRTKILGGAATHFALAASYFTDVRAIAVVGEDLANQPSPLPAALSPAYVIAKSSGKEIVSNQPNR